MNGTWRIIHAWLRRDEELPCHLYKPNPQPLPDSGRGVPPLRVGEGDRGRGYFRENPSCPVALSTAKNENGFLCHAGAKRSISGWGKSTLKKLPATLRSFVVPITRDSSRMTKCVYFRSNGKLALLHNPFLSWLPDNLSVFLLLSIILLISVFILSGCSTGAYPLDVFPEGHYQQSFRSQEPPRLQPPTDSVPITGKEVTYNFSEAGNLINPVPASNETTTKANQLYQLNCAVCHGASGRGDGPMTSYFQQAGAPPPIDYVSPRVKSRKEGELFWIITNGLGTMPRFGPLLTSEERWALVHFIRSVSGPGQ